MKAKRLKTFALVPGTKLLRKYEVICLLGTGWEGEVYRVRELHTGIERAAKFFFPQRNERDLASSFYARKLYRLRHCDILIQYHTREKMVLSETPVTCLISELVEGELLSDFVKRQPGRRLAPFEGLHLLYSLASGIGCIHAHGEYHGDLHSENVIVNRYGLGFEVKLVDLYHLGPARAAMIRDDVCDLVRIFYDALGGARHYTKQPRQVKAICCGMKRSLILKKFRTAGQLSDHLECLDWEA